MKKGKRQPPKDSWVERAMQAAATGGWKIVKPEDKGTCVTLWVRGSRIQEKPTEQKPARNRRTRTKKAFAFRGSLIDGPSIDLLELAGLDLTDEEQDELWSQTNPRDLLLECDCVEEIEDCELEENLSTTDRYYDYEAPSKKLLAAQLREAILKMVRPT